MTKLLSLFRSDQQIIKQIQNDDDSALSYLYRANLRMVTKYIIDNNGTEHDASDLLQDALVIFWEKIRKSDFDLRSKISTYLYAIVKNKWMQELARRKRHIDLNEVRGNPGTETSVIENIQEREMIDLVKKCILQLSSLCQKILILYYYEEKSMSEIKKMTGLANENVAKSKKYQCKKELELLVKSALKESG